MQLDVESLRTFLAVLDHGGMTRAAEHLDLSQSAVSWKIKRLEERVGRPLLIRDGHTLRPSRDGRALIDDARSMVDLHDRAAARLESSELSGKVGLGAIGEVSAARVAAILGRFKRVHPSLEISFVSGSTDLLAPMVETGELDVAIIQVSDTELRSNDLVLWSEQLTWATSCEHPYADADVPLVTFGDCCFYRPLSEPMLREHGIGYTIAVSIPTTSGVYAAISAGLGVGVIGSDHLDDQVVPWRRAANLPQLPTVHQVARTVPGEHPEVAAALLAAIKLELSAPDPVSEQAALVMS